MEPKKNCQLCGKEEYLVTHHIDYKKSITLELCRSCHSLMHVFINNLNLKKVVFQKLTCKKCEWTWTYKGHHPHWACCPSCLNRVKVNV
jgi:ribosome-binding protein aMBF1 (putative translation factor)